ncbi:MAG: hypothetical protein EU532_00670 [Promethearchaeota archaeon]|nr:MAG: hypothetical protein EU532_00670 [Candidatus Lokiarchaeota archaeon]
MVELTPLEILNGSMSVLYVILNIIVGLVLISKYFKYKSRPLLFMGISMILLSEVWFTHGLAFILILTTGSGLSPEMFFLCAYTLVPWATLSWMVVITDLIYKDKQKLILSIYTIFGIVYSLFFFYLLFTNISLIGQLESPIDPHTGPFLTGYLLIILINVFITGFLFFRESRKSKDSEIRLKGLLFFLSSTSFVIASILDTLPLNIVIIIIVRLLLILAAIEIYGAFILPEWMKKLFLKEKKS